MLIECLIKREEPVTVRDIHGFRYEFKPDKDGHKICEVNSGEHRSMMLAFPESYKVYALYIDSGLFSDVPIDTVDEEEFTKEWMRLRKNAFLDYVQEHIETFNICSSALRQKAIEKWNRFFYPDTKIWPGRI